jgi:hypothetical protein
MDGWMDASHSLRHFLLPFKKMKGSHICSINIDASCGHGGKMFVMVPVGYFNGYMEGCSSAHASSGYGMKMSWP